jgi:hypothetical protein
MIDQPGLYSDIPAPEYHADPCPTPSLSASMAKIILDQSPLHGFFRHPRLGGSVERYDSTRPQQIGVAAHRLLLGKGADLVFVDSEDWRTVKAKAERDQALAEGKAPILRCDYHRVEDAVNAAFDTLIAYPELRGLADAKGLAETVIAWQEGDIWCRGLVDFLDPERGVRVDLKTTSASAHPASVSRRLFGSGVEVQDRFYHRGLQALGQRHERSLFIVLEMDEPYGLSVAELDPEAQELGDSKTTKAISLWGRCLREQRWPGYEPRIASIGPPPWHQAEWIDREAANDAARAIDERVVAGGFA